MFNPQAVILAGGKGTRLRPLTYKVPKGMIDINGKPFLQYVLELLREKGVREILLLVGYLGEQIEGRFGAGERLGLSITYSREASLLGTGGALKKAERLIGPEFLLVNGDTYLDFDYHALKNRFRKSNYKGLICVYINKDKASRPNMLLGEDNRIMRYNKIDPKGLAEVDAGVGIFKKEVLRSIPKGEYSSFEGRVYKELIRRRGLYGFPVEDKFLDIGVFQRLSRARRVLR